MVLDEIFDKIKCSKLIWIGRSIFVDAFQIVFDIFGYHWNNEQTVSNPKKDGTKNHHVAISRYDVFEYGCKNVAERICPIEWKPKKWNIEFDCACILEQR